MLEIFDNLSKPFDPSKVSWRVGSTNKEKTSGLALAYIDARDVMHRLDEIVGPENWQDCYECFGNTTICYISIRIDNQWIKKGDGAGDTAVEAEKGRISDAFKRAAVKWGIGRYLYDLDSPWVELEQRGNSYAIKKSEYRKLENLLAEGRPVKSEEYEKYRLAIPKAQTLAELKDLFEAAWSLAKGDTPSRVGMKRLYDERKSQLEKETSDV